MSGITRKFAAATVLATAGAAAMAAGTVEPWGEHAIRLVDSRAQSGQIIFFKNAKLCADAKKKWAETGSAGQISFQAGEDCRNKLNDTVAALGLAGRFHITRTPAGETKAYDLTYSCDGSTVLTDSQGGKSEITLLEDALGAVFPHGPNCETQVKTGTKLGTALEGLPPFVSEMWQSRRHNAETGVVGTRKEGASHAFVYRTGLMDIKSVPADLGSIGFAVMATNYNYTPEQMDLIFNTFDPPKPPKGAPARKLER